MEIRFIMKFIMPSYRDFIGKKDDGSLFHKKKTPSLSSQNSSPEGEDGIKSAVTERG